MTRVLLVDDDPAAIAMMKALFESWRCAVDTAATGTEAVASVKAHCPQVVVSDLIMPGMNGLELLHVLRAESCQAVFIMLTGYATVPRAVAAIEDGADEVMLKPLDIELLRTTLERRGLLELSQ